MKKTWKITAVALTLALSAAPFAACAQEDGVISGNYKVASVEETYAALTSVSLDSLNVEDPETQETVTGFRLGASIKNDFSGYIKLAQEKMEADLELDLKVRAWEESKEIKNELAGNVELDFDATPKFATAIYEEIYSNREHGMKDEDGNKVVSPAIDLSADAEIYANNANAFLKTKSTGLRSYDGSIGASGMLISASIANEDFDYKYKFDTNDLLSYLFGGEVATSAAPDSSGTTPAPSFAESLGLTEQLLHVASSSYGLEYSIAKGVNSTKIKIATTEATKSVLNGILLQDYINPFKAPAFEIFHAEVYLQISKNGIPKKIATNFEIKINTPDYDATEYGGVEDDVLTFYFKNYLDVDFSWIKDTILPNGIMESTDYEAISVEDFLTLIG